MEPDSDRSFDQLAAFAEVAAERGLQTTLGEGARAVLAEVRTKRAAGFGRGQEDVANEP